MISGEESINFMHDHEWINYCVGLAGVSRRYYRTCMNESAMEANVLELKSLVLKMGGWHADGTIVTNWTVQDAIKFLQQ